MFLKELLIKNSLANNNSFIWDSKLKNLKKVEDFTFIDLNLLIGIDQQKKILFDNTLNFSKGNFTNNALLWGSRGNGKSSLIKSVFREVNKKNNKLKLLQLNKKDIFDIELIYEKLGKIKKYFFIIFIDDLSFEKIDSDYKIIKSTLDGSIQNQPKNIILYVTSNRRHLMPRDMIENERSSAIHTDESVEEKISLSDRFGLWIGFHNLSQDDFIKIIKKYCEVYNLEFNDNIKKISIRWSLQRGNRTGRSAWQFILNYAAEQNKKLVFKFLKDKIVFLNLKYLLLNEKYYFDLIVPQNHLLKLMK